MTSTSCSREEFHHLEIVGSVQDPLQDQYPSQCQGQVSFDLHIKPLLVPRDLMFSPRLVRLCPP